MAAAKQAAPATKALAKWDEELAAAAKASAAIEANTGGGQFFSLKSGVLSWDGVPFRNNEMAVIVLDAVLENVFYDKPYNPDVQVSPACFAHGRDEAQMKPHLTVINAGQNPSDDCQSCPKNAWGSADVGKGKACKNKRRLAVISAGTFAKDGSFELNDEDGHWKNTAAGFLALPPMSIKGWAEYVKSLAGGLKRPPYGVITKVKVVPDPKSQFRVLFEAIEPVPDDIMGEVMARHKAAAEGIMFPYQLGGDEDEAPAAKPAAKGKPAPQAKGKKY